MNTVWVDGGEWDVQSLWNNETCIVPLFSYKSQFNDTIVMWQVRKQTAGYNFGWSVTAIMLDEEKRESEEIYAIGQGNIMKQPWPEAFLAWWQFDVCTCSKPLWRSHKCSGLMWLVMNRCSLIVTNSWFWKTANIVSTPIKCMPSETLFTLLFVIFISWIWK
jgi:hypothetical protein